MACDTSAYTTPGSGSGPMIPPSRTCRTVAFRIPIGNTLQRIHTSVNSDAIILNTTRKAVNNTKRGGDSRVVSVSDFKVRGPGFDCRWGQRSLVMELVNIYHVLSCSFVEIIRLYVVSVCIN